MLEKGNQMAPSERQDLQLALQRGTYALLDATRRGADPERLALLETFLDMVEAKLTPPTPVEPVQTGVEALPADPALAGGVPIAPAMPAPAGTVPVM
jgi:hypothetical protein